VAAPDPDLPQRLILAAANLRSARAAALVCPRAAISHSSASIAYSMPAIGNLERPCLTVAAGTALRELAHAHLHRATLRDIDVSVVDGYRVTSPARTVMDVAREHGVAAGVVAADYALRTGLADASSLGGAFELCARWPGRRAARITLMSADGAAESPLESLSRLRIAAARLPKPRLQPEICDGYGRFLGRPDFYWDEFGVVGEADGDLKYNRGRPAIVEERERQKRFEETGLIVVRWGWSDVSPSRRWRSASWPPSAAAPGPDHRSAAGASSARPVCTRCRRYIGAQSRDSDGDGCKPRTDSVTCGCGSASSRAPVPSAPPCGSGPSPA
jgi:hypothetical protein